MTHSHWAAGSAAAVLVTLLAVGAIGRSAAPPESPPAVPAGDKLDDGVYVLLSEGDGRKVVLTDGSEAVLGKRLSASVGVAVSLKSWTNHNTRFHLHLKGLGPLPEEVTRIQTAVVVDGVVLHLGRPEKLAADGTAEVGATVSSADAARTLAARYKVEPAVRKHPGHRFEVRWHPAKPQYEVGEPVKLTMEIKNTGTGPLRFTVGGQQRGPRDNQFRFVAQAGVAGKGLPDVGDARNHGGISTSKTLRPGEVFAAEVDVTKWFAFTEPDTYRVTGVFEMPVIDPASADGFGPVVWDDLAVGDCAVMVVAKKR